jgi:hypothetical protein
MGAFEIFILRALLAVFISILLGRFYFQGKSIFWTIGLATAMLAIVYAKEYFRNKNQDQ